MVRVHRAVGAGPDDQLHARPRVDGSRGGHLAVHGCPQVGGQADRRLVRREQLLSSCRGHGSRMCRSSSRLPRGYAGASSMLPVPFSDLCVDPGRAVVEGVMSASTRSL
eukprot:scaffold42007_cov75-Phaeocystis_antarctica.AAC.7